mmetsp:Transcript_2457/g.7208  ORF Transcript_2457/g.7208 Transcript_2457/m.7208 type:complete len:110 (-) Transcript_2457:350-679(-)
MNGRQQLVQQECCCTAGDVVCRSMSTFHMVRLQGSFPGCFLQSCQAGEDIQKFLYRPAQVNGESYRTPHRCKTYCETWRQAKESGQKCESTFLSEARATPMNKEFTPKM